MTNTGYDSPARVIKHRAAGYMTRGNVLITEKLISKKSFDAMFTPVKNNYGYGWGIDKQYGLARVAHGGGINGFVTFIARYPEAKAVIIVLSNFAQANPQTIATELAKMALADKLTLPTASLTGNAAFKLKGYPNARTVALAGSFNDWNQSQTLFAREGDGWVCRINLAPGKYAYKFVVDGNWITDPANPVSEDDGNGNINSVLIVK